MKNTELEKIEGLEGLDKKLGGIFSTVAIIAIIAEMWLCGFSAEAIAGGIKDIAGTIVAVLVLFVAWSALHPKKDKTFNFDNALNSALRNWQNANENMILIKEDPRDLYMYTDIKNFFCGGQKITGRFAKIDITDKVIITFSLNKGLVVGHGGDAEQAKEQIKEVGEMITNYCSKSFNGVAKVDYDSSKWNIVVKFKATKTQQDINCITEMLDKIYQAFLVCASVKA